MVVIWILFTRNGNLLPIDVHILGAQAEAIALCVLWVKPSTFVFCCGKSFSKLFHFLFILLFGNSISDKYSVWDGDLNGHKHVNNLNWNVMRKYIRDDGENSVGYFDGWCVWWEYMLSFLIPVTCGVKECLRSWIDDSYVKTSNGNNFGVCRLLQIRTYRN